MAADDDQKDAGSDPWSSIESEGLPDLAGEFGFSFDDAPAGDAESAAEDAAAESPADQAADAEADAEIESWLDEPADDAGAGNAGAGDSAVQIGTGESGISSPSSVGGFDEPADESGTESGSGWGDAEGSDDWGSTETDAESASVDAGGDWGTTDGGDWSGSAGAPESFGGAGDSDQEPHAAADAEFEGRHQAPDDGPLTADDVTEQPPADEAFAAASRPASPSRARAKPKRRKASGIGQMVGVVLGGAMAIPITMAILIWGLQKDPFKVTEIAVVQEYGGFLLPEKFRAGAVKKAGPKQGGSPLDQLGTIVPPAPEPTADAPPEPAAGEPDPLLPVSVPEEPAPPPPAPPEPEPLDTAALDTAAVAASTALDAVLAIEDPEDGARKKLLVKCYKALAKVADELSQLERTAADSGRPLAGPPEVVSTLHDRLASRPAVRDDLAGLAVAWLKFPNRGSDGIFLQLKFGKARRVGPYWCSEATLQEPDGERDVTLISRSEPSAVSGDVVAVTGLVMDDDVIWAADLRPATGAGGLSAP
jgi:hypothetical protein